MKVDAGKAVDYGFSVFNNGTFKAIAPKASPPFVEAFKAVLDFTHSFRMVG